MSLARRLLSCEQDQNKKTQKKQNSGQKALSQNDEGTRSNAPKVSVSKETHASVHGFLCMVALSDGPVTKPKGFSQIAKIKERKK